MYNHIYHSSLNFCDWEFRVRVKDLAAQISQVGHADSKEEADECEPHVYAHIYTRNNCLSSHGYSG